VHPQAEQESILGQFLEIDMGVVDLVVLDRVWRATGKKRKKIVNFFKEKSAPPDKILATPMVL